MNSFFLRYNNDNRIDHYNYPEGILGSLYCLSLTLIIVRFYLKLTVSLKVKLYYCIFDQIFDVPFFLVGVMKLQCGKNLVMNLMNHTNGWKK